jgi:hypothetical protein
MYGLRDGEILLGSLGMALVPFIRTEKALNSCSEIRYTQVAGFGSAIWYLGPQV